MELSYELYSRLFPSCYFIGIYCTYLIHTLGSKASAVENLFYVGEPARNCQSGHPLVWRWVHVTTGFHELGVRVEEKMVAVNGLADPPPPRVVDLGFVSSALLPLWLRHSRCARVFFFEERVYTPTPYSFIISSTRNIQIHLNLCSCVQSDLGIHCRPLVRSAFCWKQIYLISGLTIFSHSQYTFVIYGA